MLAELPNTLRAITKILGCADKHVGPMSENGEGSGEAAGAVREAGCDQGVDQWGRNSEGKRSEDLRR